MTKTTSKKKIRQLLGNKFPYSVDCVKALKKLKKGQIKGFLSRMLPDGSDEEVFEVLDNSLTLDEIRGLIGCEWIEALPNRDKSVRIYGNENGAYEDKYNQGCTGIITMFMAPIHGNILFLSTKGMKNS